MRKKNKTMRAAGALFLATMLTTSMTAGTFAKYTTGDSASDSARVAKFGVTATVAGTLFAENYYTNKNTPAAANVAYISGNNNTTSADTSVLTENIVAPGTKNDKGMTIDVKGTPEVATNVAITIDNDSNYSTIYLAKDHTYGIMVKMNKSEVTEDNYRSYYVYDDTNEYYVAATSYDTSRSYYKLKDSVATTSDYYPISWTVDVNGTTTTTTDLSALSTAVAKTGTYDSNVDLSDTSNVGYRTITWEWVYETSPRNISNEDKMDTILGDLMAETTTNNYDVVMLEGTNYYPATIAAPNVKGERIVTANSNEIANLGIAFNATVSVTQLD